MRVFLVYSVSQASPRWWEVLGHRWVLVSADDVAGGALGLPRGVELIIDSGGFRLVSRGARLDARVVLGVQEGLVEEYGGLPVVLDYPVPPDAGDAEVWAANKATLRNALLWQRVFGDHYLLPLHARTEAQLVEAYREARRVLGRVEHVGLGSQALVSRTNPCRVLGLLAVLRGLHDAHLHAFGVGNTTLILASLYGLADTADTAAPLIDARYGLARHPETLQMPIVAPRASKQRRPRAKPEEVARRCNCPVCRSNPRLLAEWGRRGLEARAIHNAYQLLRLLGNPEEALEKLPRARKCAQKIRELLRASGS